MALISEIGSTLAEYGAYKQEIMEFGADVGQQHAIMLDMQLLSITRYTRTTMCIQNNP